MSEEKGAALPVLQSVQVVDTRPPLDVGVACHAVPLGVGVQALCTQPEDDTGLAALIGHLNEEKKDYTRYAMQLLFECTTPEQYDETLKAMKEDLLQRQQGQLHDALEVALEHTVEHRSQLPVPEREDADEPLVFPRPGNSNGQWGVVECALEEPVDHTGAGGVEFAIGTTLVQVARNTLPAGYLDTESGVLTVAYVDANAPIVHVVCGTQYRWAFSLPKEHPRPVLHVHAHDARHFIVSYEAAAVYHERDTGVCHLHVIEHPACPYMITACRVQDAAHLLIGTAIGCVWDVSPTTSGTIYAVDVLPKVLAVRALREGLALTVDAVHLTRAATSIQMFRPLDAVLDGTFLAVLSKSGPVLCYDVERKRAPAMIQPPADAPHVQYVMPVYQALALHKNELSVAYPDGLLRVFRIKK